MKIDQAKNLTDSAIDFQRVVWPRMSQWCGGGQLVPVESVMNTGFTKQLDVLAGIDAWQVQHGQGIRAIASRVQWDDGRAEFPWNTFTIRARKTNGCVTEYAKRLQAIQTGNYIYPHLTIHGYVSQPRREGVLRSAAMARTIDVFAMIERREYWTMKTSDAWFYCVNWARMKHLGFRVHVWPYVKGDGCEIFAPVKGVAND